MKGQGSLRITPAPDHRSHAGQTVNRSITKVEFVEGAARSARSDSRPTSALLHTRTLGADLISSWCGPSDGRCRRWAAPSANPST